MTDFTTPKRAPEQEHMPIIRLTASGFDNVTGQHVECDYCDADAVWHHWASPEIPGRPHRLDVHRDCYACVAHVGLLNRNYEGAAE